MDIYIISVLTSAIALPYFSFNSLYLILYSSLSIKLRESTWKWLLLPSNDDSHFSNLGKKQYWSHRFLLGSSSDTDMDRECWLSSAEKFT